MPPVGFMVIKELTQKTHNKMGNIKDNLLVKILDHIQISLFQLNRYSQLTLFYYAIERKAFCFIAPLSKTSYHCSYLILSIVIFAFFMHFNA